MRVFLEHTQYWLYRFLTSSVYRRFILYSIIYGSKKRFAARNFRFQGFNLFAPDTLSFIWQYKEIFDDENYRFKTFSESPVIYDCGANIGMSCLFFSKNYPSAKIRAFEADPAIADILRQNLSRNNAKNVEVINKAVWINNEIIELGLDGTDGASVHSDSNRKKIPAIRLKDYLEKETIVDMLKIDIEGAENEVIMDCRSTLEKVQNIFIEYHSFARSEQRLSNIISILEEKGFRYFIRSVSDRETPFLHRKNKSNPGMDLQLNIYGYK